MYIGAKKCPGNVISVVKDLQSETESAILTDIQNTFGNQTFRTQGS